MNLTDMLPLLLKNGNPQMAGIMSAMNGGDTSQLLESLMGQDGKNKELMTMLKLMQQEQKKTQKPPAAGLKAIYNFAPKDILGLMVKYYANTNNK